MLDDNEIRLAGIDGPADRRCIDNDEGAPADQPDRDDEPAFIRGLPWKSVADCRSDSFLRYVNSSLRRTPRWSLRRGPADLSDRFVDLATSAHLPFMHDSALGIIGDDCKLDRTPRSIVLHAAGEFLLTRMFAECIIVISSIASVCGGLCAQ